MIKNHKMDTRKVTFSHDTGQVIVDNSLGEANVSSFEFLSFDENFELIPIKDANRYQGMHYIVWCRFVHLFCRYIYPHSTYPHVSCTSDDDHRAVWPDSLQRVWQGAHQGAAPARQVTGPRPAQVTSDWWRAGHVTSVLTSDWWRAGHVTSVLTSDWWRAGHMTSVLTSDWWKAGHVTSVLTSDWCSGSCWTTRRGASRLTTAACGCWTSRRRCSPGTGCLTRVIYGPDTGCFIRTSSDASDHGSSPKRCGSGSAAARLRRWMSSE